MMEKVFCASTPHVEKIVDYIFCGFMMHDAYKTPDQKRLMRWIIVDYRELKTEKGRLFSSACFIAALTSRLLPSAETGFTP